MNSITQWSIYSERFLQTNLEPPLVFEFKNRSRGSRGSSGPRPGSGSVPVRGRSVRPSSVKELTGLALEVEKIYSASQKSTPKALPFTPYLIPLSLIPQPLAHVIY